MTIFEVAKAAGVSVASVSYVLNGRGKLSPATEQTIRRVMRELGYHPRPHQARDANRARGVREKSGRSSTPRPGLVVLLVSDTRLAAAQTQQVGIITAAASGWLTEFGQEMILAAIPSDGGVPLCLGDKRLRGVLLRGSGTLSTAQRKALEKVPCVEFFGDNKPVKWDQVIVDDQGVGRLAFQTLQKKGCDHFVVCSPDRLHYAFNTRLNAFRFSAMEEGFPVNVVETQEGERIELDAVARQPRERLGVFFVGQNHANGIAELDRKMREAGLDETHGVHRVGVSMNGECPHDMIALSLERLGHMCAQQLVWRMQQPTAEFQRILISPHLREAGDADSQDASEPQYHL